VSPRRSTPGRTNRDGTKFGWRSLAGFRILPAVALAKVESALVFRPFGSEGLRLDEVLRKMGSDFFKQTPPN